MAKLRPRYAERRCPDCGEVQPYTSYAYTKAGWLDPHGKGRYTYCRRCSVRRSREYRLSHMEEVRLKAAEIAQRPRVKALRLERQKKRVARIKRSPKLREKYREQQRLWQWEKRRRLGIAERNFQTKPMVSDHEKIIRLDRKPFLAWLDNLAEKFEYRWGLVAEVVGIPERTLNRIRKTQKLVTLDVVDRALTNEGSTLIQELYPELYES